MEKKPRSLHEIAGMPEPSPSSQKKIQHGKDAMERIDWNSHKKGREQGQDRNSGVKGVAYPLHRAVADAEGRVLPQDEAEEFLKDDDTEEVDDPNTFNPDSWE